MIAKAAGAIKPIQHSQFNTVNTGFGSAGSLLTVFPVLLGGGPRLFDDGPPTSKWTLVSRTTGEDGTLALVYDRLH